MKEPILQSVDTAKLYLNRELSLLDFQARVLEEAEDESNPLLERFKFLSILGSNLEEFFMVRVAALKRQLEAGNRSTAKDGMTITDQLREIREETLTLVAAANRLRKDTLIPELEKQGIVILPYEDLNDKQRTGVDAYFSQSIFPVLTPLAFDSGHPFPHISNLSFNLAVLLCNSKGEQRFARIKIPEMLPQLIAVETPSGKSEQSFIWIEDVIIANLTVLFPGMTILDAHPFSLARDAEMEIQEWEADDLLETTEEGIRQRRFGDVVRLTVHKDTPELIMSILISNLEIDAQDIYQIDTRRPLSSLKHIFSIDRPDLKDPPHVPVVPQILNPDLQEGSIFSAIRRQDILLHHPFDSFQPVINFFNSAAQDPNVLAIKTTLYRVGKNSPIVEALLDASRRGKEVAVLVELKARFDEESNVEWAKAMEHEGVHVIYGLPGLKVHSKIALVVRQEGDAIRRYTHLSTGNYNAVTAHLYTDLGFLTCDDDIGSDGTELFNYLTGYTGKQDYRKLLIAPTHLSQQLEAMIKREIAVQKRGGVGHLIFKMNSLVEERMIELLYEASQAGVQVDLIVRGICCLVPGIPGVSDNITVRSIVGRFLEHSRVYYFHNGGDEEIYLGSADLMPRNLHRRVEIVFPIQDLKILRYLRDEYLETYLHDCVKARHMQSDGSYTRNRHEHTPDCVNSQLHFIEHRTP